MILDPRLVLRPATGTSDPPRRDPAPPQSICEAVDDRVADRRASTATSLIPVFFAVFGRFIPDDLAGLVLLSSSAARRSARPAPRTRRGPCRAPGLLGARLVRDDGDAGPGVGRITEVEAYGGSRRPSVACALRRHRRATRVDVRASRASPTSTLSTACTLPERRHRGRRVAGGRPHPGGRPARRASTRCGDARVRRAVGRGPASTGRPSDARGPSGSAGTPGARDSPADPATRRRRVLDRRGRGWPSTCLRPPARSARDSRRRPSAVVAPGEVVAGPRVGIAYAGEPLGEPAVAIHAVGRAGPSRRHARRSAALMDAKSDRPPRVPARAGSDSPRRRPSSRSPHGRGARAVQRPSHRGARPRRDGRRRAPSSQERPGVGIGGAHDIGPAIERAARGGRLGRGPVRRHRRDARGGRPVSRDVLGRRAAARCSATSAAHHPRAARPAQHLERSFDPTGELLDTRLAAPRRPAPGGARRVRAPSCAARHARPLERARRARSRSRS